jgi:DNA-binding PucR family transcriptional regulator
LIEHDREHRTHLIETLHAFFEEGGHQRRTADRLDVHVNTLAGRLQRIAEVAAVDLTDATTRLHLQLALQFLRLTRVD